MSIDGTRCATTPTCCRGRIRIVRPGQTGSCETGRWQVNRSDERSHGCSHTATLCDFQGVVACSRPARIAGRSLLPSAGFCAGFAWSNDLLAMFHAFASSSNSETEATRRFQSQFGLRTRGCRRQGARASRRYRPQPMSLGLPGGHDNQEGGHPDCTSFVESDHEFQVNPFQPHGPQFGTSPVVNAGEPGNGNGNVADGQELRVKRCRKGDQRQQDELADSQH